MGAADGVEAVLGVIELESAAGDARREVDVGDRDGYVERGGFAAGLDPHRDVVHVVGVGVLGGVVVRRRGEGEHSVGQGEVGGVGPGQRPGDGQSLGIVGRVGGDRRVGALGLLDLARPAQGQRLVDVGDGDGHFPLHRVGPVRRPDGDLVDVVGVGVARVLVVGRRPEPQHAPGDGEEGRVIAPQRPGDGDALGVGGGVGGDRRGPVLGVVPGLGTAEHERLVHGGYLDGDVQKVGSSVRVGGNNLKVGRRSGGAVEIEHRLGRHLPGLGIHGEMMSVGMGETVGEGPTLGIEGLDGFADRCARRGGLGQGSGHAEPVFFEHRLAVPVALHRTGGDRRGALSRSLRVGVRGGGLEEPALVPLPRRVARGGGAADLRLNSVGSAPLPGDLGDRAVGVGGERGGKRRPLLGLSRRQGHHPRLIDVDHRHRHFLRAGAPRRVGGHHRHLVARLGLEVGRRPEGQFAVGDGEALGVGALQRPGDFVEVGVGGGVGGDHPVGVLFELHRGGSADDRREVGVGDGHRHRVLDLLLVHVVGRDHRDLVDVVPVGVRRMGVVGRRLEPQHPLVDREVAPVRPPQRPGDLIVLRVGGRVGGHRRGLLLYEARGPGAVDRGRLVDGGHLDGDVQLRAGSAGGVGGLDPDAVALLGRGPVEVEACLGGHLPGGGVEGKRLRVVASDLVGERLALGVEGGERLSDGRARRGGLRHSAGGIGRIDEARRTVPRRRHSIGGYRRSGDLFESPSVCVRGGESDPIAPVVCGDVVAGGVAERMSRAVEELSTSIGVGPSPVYEMSHTVLVRQCRRQLRPHGGFQRRQRHHPRIVDVGHPHRHPAPALLAGGIGGDHCHRVARLGLVIGR